MSISRKARGKLHPFGHVECPACEAHLRLKWGRTVLSGYLALLALLAVGALVEFPGFHHLPAVAVIWIFCVGASFPNLIRRLPLEPKP
jgi:hypothetical protein